MLEEKLRQASQTHAQQRKRLFVLLGMAVIISIIAILLMMRFVNSNTPSPIPPTLEQTPASSISPAAAAKLRSAFMLKLRHYENEIEPALHEAHLQDWNVPQQRAIKKLKDKATSAFSLGDFTTANTALNDLENMAQQTLAQREDIFSSQVNMAATALKADDYDTAKLHIDQALQLKANNPAALQLAQQIDALPEIIKLLNQAAIARTENNLEKEYAAVSQAFKLAPHRQELPLRQCDLAKRIKEKQFTPLIARGLEHVNRRKLSAARSDYQQAKAIAPQRSELSVLQQAINKLAISLDLSRSISQAHDAIQQDHWRKAQSIYTTAIQRHPNNKTISEGLQLSNKLVSLHNALDRYLQKPERLTSPNIAAQAQDVLIQTRVFATNSPSLQQKSAALKKLITTANIDIPVSITSDNKTFIVVRGVGKVGLTEQRTIQLKAGLYSFEGRRVGYQSKLVQVRIPIGATSFAIEVICDKRI